MFVRIFADLQISFAHYAGTEFLFIIHVVEKTEPYILRNLKMTTFPDPQTQTLAFVSKPCTPRASISGFAQISIVGFLILLLTAFLICSEYRDQSFDPSLQPLQEFLKV